MPAKCDLKNCCTFMAGSPLSRGAAGFRKFEASFSNQFVTRCATNYLSRPQRVYERHLIVKLCSFVLECHRSLRAKRTWIVIDFHSELYCWMDSSNMLLSLAYVESVNHSIPLPFSSPCFLSSFVFLSLQEITTMFK